MSLMPWLLYEKSLTDKLKDTAGDARLDVIDQRWESPDAWDQQVVKLNTTSVIHREILMWAFDTPCWYARTIIPDTTFQANTALFDRLKTESLGELIFNGTDIQRASLKHYLISSTSLEYSWLSGVIANAVKQSSGSKYDTGLLHCVRNDETSEQLWVRSSEFIVKGQHSFFLVEILLPGLSRYLS